MPRPPLFSISADSIPRVRDLLREMPFELATNARDVFERTLKAYKVEMVARSTSGPLIRQTGRLARSWGPADGNMATGDRLSNLQAFLASFSDRKSFLHEFGGTVFPAKGSRSWIFIPTDNNRKINGTAIYTPSQVLSAGGTYYNRRKEARSGEQQIYAVIQGKTSPAWNLLLNANRQPMFIQVKRAVYQAQLGFYDAGAKYEQRLVPRLADLVVDYWKTAA